MSQYLPYLIIGLVSGSLYGLAGLGLVLSYRTSGIFNFGYGAIAAAAAFVFYTLHDQNHIAWPLAALITLVIFGFGVGLIMERLTRSLAESAEVVIVALTVGVLLAVEGLLFIQYGDVTLFFPAFLPSTGFHISDVLVTWSQVIVAAIALSGATGLYVFLRKTRLGTFMRGVVDNPSLVSLTGEKPARVTRVAWIIGCAFSAIAGVLLAPTLGLDANLLTLLVVQAFGACAIGAFSSLPLTYVGGLVVGVLAALATKVFTQAPWNGLSPSVPFIVLIVVLLIVPVRLLPRARTALSLTPSGGRHNPRLTRGLVSVVIAFFLLVPWFTGNHLANWMTGLIYMIIFSSLGLLVWMSGQISLSVMAFVALGATTMAHLHNSGVPWGFALLLAGVITAPVGALIAIPARRLSGIYLALVTLGFGILMQEVVFQSSLMFGPLNVTASRPHIWFLNGGSDRTLYYIVLACLAIIFGFLALLQRSQLGRLLRATAEAPTMLATNGLNVTTTRIIVFSLSAFVAGVGGALLITQFRSASGVQFGPQQSLILLTILVICGTRMLAGAIIAGLLYAVLPGYLNSFGVDQQTLAFGLAAIVAALVLAHRSLISDWLRRRAVNSHHRQLSGPTGFRTRLGTIQPLASDAKLGR